MKWYFYFIGGNMIFLLPLIAAATSATEIIGTTIGTIGIGCALKGASDSKRAKEIVRTSNKLKEDEEDLYEDELKHLHTQVMDIERMKRYYAPTLEKSMKILSQHKNDS